mgnify:CR=1 FL=1
MDQFPGRLSNMTVSVPNYLVANISSFLFDLV